MLSLSNTVESALISSGDAAVQKTLASGGNGAVKPFNEPTGVAAIVLAGVPALAAAWSPTLKGQGLSATLTGVFCHSSPQVRFTGAHGRSRVELADLLLVVDEVSGGSVSDRRAQLVQAKIPSAGAIKIPSSGQSAKQLDLFRTWPLFTFVPGGFAPGHRDFGGSGPASWTHSGAYGGVELGTPRAWWQSPPSATMSALGAPSLAEALVGMLTGATGAGRTAVVPGPDDWSTTVHELLTVTFSLPFRQGGGGGGQRGKSVPMMYRAHMVPPPDLGAVSLTGHGDIPPGERWIGDGERPHGPISIVRIAVSRQGE